MKGMCSRFSGPAEAQDRVYSHHVICTDDAADAEPATPHCTTSPLPFVSNTNGTRCNWCVEASGNYQRDFERGAQFAQRLVTAMRCKTVTPFFLEQVVNAMPAEKGAVEHGFFSTIADTAARAA